MLRGRALRFRRIRAWSAPFLAMCFVCVRGIAQTPDQEQWLRNLYGPTIAHSGETVISTHGTGGSAVVTIKTEEMEGACGESCPSSRFWTTQHYPGHMTSGSFVQSMTISVNGRSLIVPNLVYWGMYEVNRAKVSPSGSGFLLNVYGSDAAFAYRARIYFDETGVRSMSDTGECGLEERVQFVRSAENRSKGVGRPPAKSGVRVPLKKPGQTKVELRTAAGRVSASIQIMPFEAGCAVACPDTSELSKTHPHTPAFLEKITFFFNGKPTSSESWGEQIRGGDLQYGIAVDPRWVSLRKEGSQFLLRISGGEEATANFKEFRFDSKGVHSFTVSESPSGPVAVTHFYSSVCE